MGYSRNLARIKDLEVQFHDLLLTLWRLECKSGIARKIELRVIFRTFECVQSIFDSCGLRFKIIISKDNQRIVFHTVQRIKAFDKILERVRKRTLHKIYNFTNSLTYEKIVNILDNLNEITTKLLFIFQ